MPDKTRKPYNFQELIRRTDSLPEPGPAAEEIWLLSNEQRRYIWHLLNDPGFKPTVAAIQNIMQDYDYTKQQFISKIRSGNINEISGAILLACDRVGQIDFEELPDCREAIELAFLDELKAGRPESASMIRDKFHNINFALIPGFEQSVKDGVRMAFHEERDRDAFRLIIEIGKGLDLSQELRFAFLKHLRRGNIRICNQIALECGAGNLLVDCDEECMDAIKEGYKRCIDDRRPEDAEGIKLSFQGSNVSFRILQMIAEAEPVIPNEPLIAVPQDGRGAPVNAGASHPDEIAPASAEEASGAVASVDECDITGRIEVPHIEQERKLANARLRFEECLRTVNLPDLFYIFDEYKKEIDFSLIEGYKDLLRRAVVVCMEQGEVDNATRLIDELGQGIDFTREIRDVCIAILLSEVIGHLDQSNFESISRSNLTVDYRECTATFGDAINIREKLGKNVSFIGMQDVALSPIFQTHLNLRQIEIAIQIYNTFCRAYGSYDKVIQYWHSRFRSLGQHEEAQKLEAVFGNEIDFEGLAKDERGVPQEQTTEEAQPDETSSWGEPVIVTHEEATATSIPEPESGAPTVRAPRDTIVGGSWVVQAVGAIISANKPEAPANIGNEPSIIVRDEEAEEKEAERINDIIRQFNEKLNSGNIDEAISIFDSNCDKIDFCSFSDCKDAIVTSLFTYLRSGDPQSVLIIHDKFFCRGRGFMFFDYLGYEEAVSEGFKKCIKEKRRSDADIYKTFVASYSSHIHINFEELERQANQELIDEEVAKINEMIDHLSRGEIDQAIAIKDTFFKNEQISPDYRDFGKIVKRQFSNAFLKGSPETAVKIRDKFGHGIDFTDEITELYFGHLKRGNIKVVKKMEEDFNEVFRSIDPKSPAILDAARQGYRVAEMGIRYDDMDEIKRHFPDAFAPVAPASVPEASPFVAAPQPVEIPVNFELHDFTAPDEKRKVLSNYLLNDDIENARIVYNDLKQSSSTADIDLSREIEEGLMACLGKNNIKLCHKYLAYFPTETVQAFLSFLRMGSYYYASRFSKVFKGKIDISNNPDYHNALNEGILLNFRNGQIDDAFSLAKEFREGKIGSLPGYIDAVLEGFYGLLISGKINEAYDYRKKFGHNINFSFDDKLREANRYCVNQNLFDFATQIRLKFGKEVDFDK